MRRASITSLAGWVAAACMLGVLALPATAMAEGMPQLDFKTPLTLDQVWWGALVFIVFFLLTWRWGLPQVSNVLERRAAMIAADLETARTAKAEADGAVAEMTQAVARARADAQAAISAAVDQARQQAAQQAYELNQRLEVQLREAEARIDAARQSALRALRQVATETAETMIARLTGHPPEPARLQRAVAAALATRGEAV